MQCTRRARSIAAALVLSAALAGCAKDTRPHQGHPMEPGHLFAGRYVDVHAPLAEGWGVTETGATGLAFAKQGDADGERFTAQVVMFDLPKVPTTPAEFEATVEQAIKKGSDPSRYGIIEESFELTAARPYPCVHYQVSAKDKQSQAGGKPLGLEVEALYCRHPVRQGTGFAVIFSHQGPAPYEHLHEDAASFFQGVSAPGRGGG